MFFNSKIKISTRAREIIFSSAKKNYPQECCGFLWGRNDTIIYAADAENVSPTDRLARFEISAGAFMAAERFGEMNSLSLMGVFHSHPDSVAVPSGKDLESALPNFIYLIVAVSNNLVEEERCWALSRHGLFKELSMQNIIIQTTNT